MSEAITSFAHKQDKNEDSSHSSHDSGQSSMNTGPNSFPIYSRDIFCALFALNQIRHNPLFP